MTKKKVEPDAPTPPQRPHKKGTRVDEIDFSTRPLIDTPEKLENIHTIARVFDVVKEFVMPKEKLWTCKICGLDKQTGETCPVDGGARS